MDTAPHTPDTLAPVPHDPDRVSLSSVPQSGAQWDQLLKRMVRDEATRPGIASFSSSV